MDRSCKPISKWEEGQNSLSCGGQRGTRTQPSGRPCRPPRRWGRAEGARRRRRGASASPSPCSSETWPSRGRHGSLPRSSGVGGSLWTAKHSISHQLWRIQGHCWNDFGINLSSFEVASTPWVLTNQWFMTGMKMAEVMVSTLTSRKRRFWANKTTFLRDIQTSIEEDVCEVDKEHAGASKWEKEVSKE